MIINRKVPIKKTIIQNWKINKQNLFSCLKIFSIKNWFAKKSSATRRARNRKKLVKIVRNW
jgi:hypothetical protein